MTDKTEAIKKMVYKKQGFVVKKSDKEQRHNLWDAEAEALIALLALRLSKIRDFQAAKVVNELNYNYLKKRKRVTNFSNYTPTAYQRQILKQTGY